MTETREALIEKLVVCLHLNVAERQLLGSDCVSVEEVAPVIKRLLQQECVFPHNAGVWKQGEIVFEGFFLVKRPDGSVQLNWQRSNPIKPTELADRGSSDYSDLDKAVTAFIQNEWSSGIDGIRLVSKQQPVES